jgi:hypothetical protein
LPVIVERVAEEDADAEVDIDEVVGDELTVDDDAGGDVHGIAPGRHLLVRVVAGVGVIERAPTAE